MEFVLNDLSLHLFTEQKPLDWVQVVISTTCKLPITFLQIRSTYDY